MGGPGCSTASASPISLGVDARALIFRLRPADNDTAMFLILRRLVGVDPAGTNEVFFRALVLRAAVALASVGLGFAVASLI